MATKEQLEIAREKSMLSPNTGKRGRGRKTIAKEMARSAYEAKILEEWYKLVDVQLKEATKPKNRQERQYVIDQVIGKAEKRGKADVEVEIDLDF